MHKSLIFVAIVRATDSCSVADNNFDFSPYSQVYSHWRKQWRTACRL